MSLNEVHTTLCHGGQEYSFHVGMSTCLLYKTVCVYLVYVCVVCVYHVWVCLVCVFVFTWCVCIRKYNSTTILDILD